MGTKIADIIVEHFNLDPAKLKYGNGQRGLGWYYDGKFLHTKLNAIMSTPAWTSQKIEDLFTGRD